MHTRYMERSNSVGRVKRGLDSSSVNEGQPNPKRPALASVIVEALKVDSLQKLCSSLEPILRRVVSEEVERALAKIGPFMLPGRASPKHIEGPDGRNLQLQFRSRLSLPLFTGGKVEGEQGAAIHIVLVDINTGHFITSGPESSVKLDVVVLEGDFDKEDDESWTQEEFDSHIVKEREGKRPLLTGEVQVTLKDGVGTLGDLSFTDNSSWIRSRKFRLGLKVTPGCSEGVRIREAKTEAFTVKDHRGELYKKHYPPALKDEVWRLEKIGKDGSFHKRLNKAGVFTVEDFLQLVVRDQQRLRNILGSGMSNKMWDVLLDHAKTCVLSAKLYVYYPEDARNVGVVFNNIYEFTGLIADGQYLSTDSLSESQKVYVDTLVRKAYDNWMHVIEYDGKSLLSQNQEGGTGEFQAEFSSGLHDHSENQLPVPSLQTPAAVEQPYMDSGQGGGGYNNGMNAASWVQPQSLNASNSFQCDTASFPPHNPLLSSQNVLGHGPSQQSVPNFHNPSPSNLQSFSEEDIRMRTHDMLENEDMQQLLHAFNLGGHGSTSFNTSEDNFGFSSPYMPNMPSGFEFNDDRSMSSGKAVVGWLKLKAALRWGIFVRKKAAERRAQLVELDDM
ncbi:hypothetical protein SAY87_012725 [Trapa incisa]|uniref:Calmodulin-binding protein n=1 Tax=Trapa incisa TaxID=236973 RepID=A0AAN7GKI1_9MYRT|nr:hypothetical protein SAY87_012725 [Trapa incisa]